MVTIGGMSKIQAQDLRVGMIVKTADSRSVIRDLDRVTDDQGAIIHIELANGEEREYYPFDLVES